MREVRLRFSVPAAIWITFWLMYADNGSAAGSLCAAVLHELGHLTVLLGLRDPPDGIGFGLFGVRLERSERANLSYIQEFWAAAAGPAVNLLCGTALFLLRRRNAAGIHFLLAGFNLLPIRPMDGGQMLYALLCRHCLPAQAAAICKKIAVGGLVPLAAIEVWLVLRGRGNYSILFALAYVISLILP